MSDSPAMINRVARPRPALRGVPWLALLVLAAVLACATAGEWIAPFDPNDMDLGASFQPPV